MNFQEYHEINPHIYDEFKRYTMDLINMGRDHYGAKGIIEVIRYHRTVKAKGYPLDSKVFKINNNYAPDYARKFMEEYPQYASFFRTRQLKKAQR